MKYSYLIPFKADHDNFRTKNLFKVLNWLGGLDVPEIVIVEQDSRAALNTTDLPIGCKHIFIDDSGVFNKSRAINTAFKEARGNVLAIGDCDVFLSREALLKSIKACEETYEAVNPYGHLIDLPQGALDIQAILEKERLEQNIGALDTDRKAAGEYLCFSGGLIVFRRSFFEYIGGFDERFEGWGGEDDAMDVKIQAFTANYKQFDAHQAYHLWHPRDSQRKENLCYGKNVELLKAYWKMTPKELETMRKKQSERFAAGLYSRHYHD